MSSQRVTPLDRTVLAGLHPSARKLPLVPGNEGAGVVIEDPSGHFSPGERVLFFAGPGGVAQDGTFAEIASVPSGNLAPLPGEIPDEIAGGLPVAYLSAFLALRQAGFRAGQSVLAPGAGGSVGNAPAHDQSFPLEQAPEALRHLIEDRPFGKVTLTVGASGDLARAGAGHRGDVAG